MLLIRRKTLIKEFAGEIAKLQKKADYWYYDRDNRAMFNYNIDKANAIAAFSRRFGICEEVYNEAYKIYDFRNSGKEGYILRDGKIVKEDDYA